MVLRAQSSDQKFIGVAMGVNMASDPDYDRWQQKVKAIDVALTALQAVRQYVAGLPRMPEALHAIDQQCAQALVAAGVA